MLRTSGVRMLSLLVGLAFAGPIFTGVSEPVDLHEDGNWPRIFPADGGQWHFLHATVGDYQYALLDETFERVGGSERAVTGSTILRDHGLSRCPDGTYLDAATADIDRPADSLYLYHYDASFHVIGSTTLIESADASMMMADVPSVCGETFKGVAWLMPYDSIVTRYAELTDDLELGPTHDLIGAPQAMGSSLMDDDGTLRVVGFPTLDEQPPLIAAGFDGAFVEQEHVESSIVPTGWTPYWAQASARVGDVFIIAHMAQDDAYSWNTQGGDLWVEAFDTEWNLVDQLRVTYNEAPIGGMQPGMYVDGDRLLLTYSKDLHNYLYIVTIDTEACGVGVDTGDTGTTGDSGDTGPTDSGPQDTQAADDTGAADTDVPGADDTGKPSEVTSCGCASSRAASSPFGAVAPLLFLAAAVLRRRTPLTSGPVA